MNPREYIGCMGNRNQNLTWTLNATERDSTARVVSFSYTLVLLYHVAVSH